MDSIYAANHLSGRGAIDPHRYGLFTYDFSMHEYGLAGQQAVQPFGKTFRVLQPTSYSRLFDGDTVATNLRLFLETPLSRSVSATIGGEFYQRGGVAQIAHHWGPHVPNFYSASESFVPNFLNVEFNYREPRGKTTWKLQGGDFYPEYSSVRHGNVTTSNFVLRGAPQPTWFRNAGHIGFEDYPNDYFWPGRDRFRGVDLQFAGPVLHGEVFKGADDRPAFLQVPTDVSGARTYSRDLVGAHVGARAGAFEAGLLWMNVYGNRTIVPWERQTQWALNASCRFLEEASLYGIISDSRYHRADHASSYCGTAWLAGLGGKIALLDKKHPLEYALEYKNVSPNYDPMLIHKSEHYPTNYTGWWLRLVQPLPDARLSFSYLEHRQIDPGMSLALQRDAEPDPFFVVPGNTQPGRVSTMWLEGRYRVPGWPLALTLGYENARHRLSSPQANVAKNVDQVYAGARVPLDPKQLWLDLIWYDFRIGGHWRQVPGTIHTVSYALRQQVPRLGLIWQFHKDSRLWIQYSPQTTVDRSIINGTRPDADWQNDQWLVELRARF